ncbi:MAG TPA: hypothetical protein VD884_07870 [Ohtaekwangia sp.]|nr:hypothetical protein [Ohtaekwangia sp.]
MNKHVKPIASYEDLIHEKERLEELLKVQRNQITKDLDEIREEFRPVVIASEMFGKLLSREDGKDPLVSTGTNFTIDLLVGKLFAKSNFLVRLFVPAILKNLSSHYIPKAPVMQKRKVTREPVLAGE